MPVRQINLPNNAYFAAFYLQNVGSIHEDTKKETCPNGQVP